MRLYNKSSEPSFARGKKREKTLTTNTITEMLSSVRRYYGTRRGEYVDTRWIWCLRRCRGISRWRCVMDYSRWGRGGWCGVIRRHRSTKWRGRRKREWLLCLRARLKQSIRMSIYRYRCKGGGKSTCGESNLNGRWGVNEAFLIPLGLFGEAIGGNEARGQFTAYIPWRKLIEKRVRARISTKPRSIPGKDKKKWDWTHRVYKTTHTIPRLKQTQDIHELRR